MRSLKTIIKAELTGSILEPLIATIILLTVLSMAFTIFIKLNMHPTLAVKNMANSVVDSIYKETILNKNYLNQEFSLNGIQVLKEVKLNEQNDLMQLNITVFDNKNKLIKRKRLYIPD